MNEAVDQVADQAASAVVPPHQPSAGALIRQARESVGLHIAALAVALKVPVKRLEALEADRFDLLPDAVFARALAGSVCRALKIDVAPILALLPSKEAPRLGYSNENLRQVYTAPVASPRLVTWRKPSRAAVSPPASKLTSAHPPQAPFPRKCRLRNACVTPRPPSPPRAGRAAARRRRRLCPRAAGPPRAAPPPRLPTSAG